jgi:hypothetical protein
LDRLKRAITFIYAAIYGLDRASVLNAPIAAHNRCVTSRIVADDDTYAHYNVSYAALQAAGIPSILDSGSSLVRNRFFVIDGQIVWISSTSVTGTHFTYNHKNFPAFTSTELANIYETEFDEMHRGLFGMVKSDNATRTSDLRRLSIGVVLLAQRWSDERVISEVNGTDESTYFAMCSATDDTLQDAILARKQARVTVIGLFDQLSGGNQYLEDKACK